VPQPSYLSSFQAPFHFGTSSLLGFLLIDFAIREVAAVKMSMNYLQNLLIHY